MSTRCTISYDANDYHLYEECFDSDNIYLQMDGAGWAASLSSELIDWRKGEDTERPSLHLRIDVTLWRAIVEGWLKSEWAKKSDLDHVSKEINFDGLNALFSSMKKPKQDSGEDDEI